MRIKIIWVVVSCLMVLSLVLASCAPAPTAEPGPGTPAGEEKPKYGGTFVG